MQEFFYFSNMEVDYIVVGMGLAGLAFAERLKNEKKSFVVFEDNSQNSSFVAGGVYNPVVLKRFTPVWNGVAQISKAVPFYQKLEKDFDTQFDFSFDTYRSFKSIEEQNNWYAATDKPLLAPLLDPVIVKDKFHGVVAEFDFGRVKNTGRIATKSLIENYRNELERLNKIVYESFQYKALEFSESEVYYKDITAKNIVFCEGYGMHKNPYFSYLPLNEAKGELLTIHAPELTIDFLLKSAVFVLPLGNHLFKVGATFNWKDKTALPTEQGKEELIEKLKKVLSVPYRIVGHEAGIRPTVKDRRPLVGKHPTHPNLYVLNGLGTRGVMIGPTVADALFDFIENDAPLDSEISIERYANLF